MGPVRALRKAKKGSPERESKRRRWEQGEMRKEKARSEKSSLSTREDNQRTEGTRKVEEMLQPLKRKNLD